MTGSLANLISVRLGDVSVRILRKYSVPVFLAVLGILLVM